MLGAVLAAKKPFKLCCPVLFGVADFELVLDFLAGVGFPSGFRLLFWRTCLMGLAEMDWVTAAGATPDGESTSCLSLEEAEGRR